MGSVVIDSRHQALYRLDLLLGRQRYPGGREVLRSRVEPLEMPQHQAFDGSGRDWRRRARGLGPVAGADVARCLRCAFLSGPGDHGRTALATVEDALEQGGLSESQTSRLAITPEQGLDLGKG
jgi:hypothetical protein